MTSTDPTVNLSKAADAAAPAPTLPDPPQVDAPAQAPEADAPAHGPWWPYAGVFYRPGDAIDQVLYAPAFPTSVLSAAAVQSLVACLPVIVSVGALGLIQFPGILIPLLIGVVVSTAFTRMFARMMRGTAGFVDTMQALLWGSMPAMLLGPLLLLLIAGDLGSPVSVFNMGNSVGLLAAKLPFVVGGAALLGVWSLVLTTRFVQRANDLPAGKAFLALVAPALLAAALAAVTGVWLGSPA